MDDGNSILDTLLDLPVDVAEHLVDALQASCIELGNLDHDDVVELLAAAVTASAGAATRHYLAHHQEELKTSIRRSFM